MMDISITSDHTSFPTRTYLASPATRPPSSFLNFELLDNTQTSTPFEATPPTSPDKPPTTPLPDMKSLSPQDMMSSEQITPFCRDKKDEIPENFLCSFHWHMGATSNNVKKQQFWNFLEADSAADEWFNNLDEAGKKDWSAIEAAFWKCWPKKKIVKKTVEEYEQEIMSLWLKIEDLGKKKTVAGREVYVHIMWADDMETIIIGAKLEAITTYIGHVCRELPRILRKEVGMGHANWMVFLQSVHDINLDHIREGTDIWKKEEDTKRKEQDERKREIENQEALRRHIQQLEKLTMSPMVPIRQQMMTFGIGSPTPNPVQPVQQTTPSVANPFTSTTGRQSKFDFAAGFYAMLMDPESRPYMAFYIF